MWDVKKSDIQTIKNDLKEIKDCLIGTKLNPIGMIEKQCKLEKKVRYINRVMFVGYGAGLVILLFFRYGWRYFIK